MTLNLTAKGTEQEILKKYLEENASEVLAEKINNGVRIVKDGKTLISRKTLDGFMRYATEEARKQAAKGATSACIHSDIVFSWCIHYFEEDSIEGTLYNEDGTEYKQPKPTPKKKTVTPSATPAPSVTKKPESPQLSLFDFTDDLIPSAPPETPAESDEDEAEEQPIIEAKPAEKPAMSPLYQRYLHHQEEFPNTVVAMRVGDFYEVFGDAAVTIANELELTLTSRDFGLAERVKMIGYPYHTADAYREKIRIFANIAVIDGEQINFYPKHEPVKEVPTNYTVNEETGEVFEIAPVADTQEPQSEEYYADMDLMYKLYMLLDQKIDIVK